MPLGYFDWGSIYVRTVFKIALKKLAETSGSWKGRIKGATENGKFDHPLIFNVVDINSIAY